MVDRLLFPGTLMLVMSCLATGVEAKKWNDCNLTKCRFKASNSSSEYFHSRLVKRDPKFIRFNIKFDRTQRFNATKDTFQPTQWFWTYNSSKGMYPYLYWGVDFGVLSFGLLEVRTLHERPDVYMDVTSKRRDCVVTFGTRDTTKGIACALQKISGERKYLRDRYQNSYYCFRAEKPGIRNSISYTAAMYFLYPSEFINYNCCITGYNYSTGAHLTDCSPGQIKKWPECKILPFILGLIFLLYSPIIILKIGGNLSRNIEVTPQMYELIGPENENHAGANTEDDEWIYLNGYSPYTVLDWISQLLWCGLDKKYPVAISRIKRLLFLILSTTPMIFQLLLYGYWEHDLVDELVRHGCPMGFLSLLADKSVRNNYFVPKLGGGLNILVAYGILGLLILVMPSNLKQVLENGVPIHSTAFSSPLCLRMWEMHDIAMVQTSSNPGYMRCSEVCFSGIILLFSPRFWSRVFRLQYNRLCSFLDAFCFESKILFIFILIIIPFYILFCIIEVCLCMVWYGIPFIRFMFFLPTGFLSSLWRMTYNSESTHGSNVFKLIIGNPVVFGLVSITLFIICFFFTYTYYLIFIQGFIFFSQVLVYCFIAVIVYPSISFGGLFFSFALFYYIFHLIQGFGDVYLILLSEAVEISRNLDGVMNYTTTFDNTLVVSNIRAHSISRILIEGRQLSFLPRNFFQSIAYEGDNRPKIQVRDNVYGIPKKLFFILVDKHKPVNIQLLKILLQLFLIMFLLAITMRITSGFVTGPTTEISDVMHVIFIVAIGALPKVLEVAITTANESIKREIEMRRLEQTILRYWERETM